MATGTVPPAWGGNNQAWHGSDAGGTFVVLSCQHLTQAVPVDTVQSSRNSQAWPQRAEPAPTVRNAPAAPSPPEHTFGSPRPPWPRLCIRSSVSKCKENTAQANDLPTGASLNELQTVQELYTWHTKSPMLSYTTCGKVPPFSFPHWAGSSQQLGARSYWPPLPSFPVCTRRAVRSRRLRRGWCSLRTDDGSCRAMPGREAETGAAAASCCVQVLECLRHKQTLLRFRADTRSDL